MKNKQQTFKVNLKLWGDKVYDFGQDQSKKKHLLIIPLHFFNDHRLKELKGAERYLLIYLLSVCASYNECTLELHRSVFRSALGGNRNDIEGTLKRLKDLQFLEIIDIEKTLTDRLTDRLTDYESSSKKDEQVLASEKVEKASKKTASKRKNFKPQLEKIYEDFYPRREGKAKGLDRLKNQIKTEADLLNFEKAVKCYQEKIIAEKTESKYIKLFSTFCSPTVWVDYLNFERPKTVTERKQEIENELEALLTVPEGYFDD